MKLLVILKRMEELHFLFKIDFAKTKLRIQEKYKEVIAMINEDERKPYHYGIEKKIEKLLA